MSYQIHVICPGNNRKLIETFFKVRVCGKIDHFLPLFKILWLQSTSLKLVLVCLVSEENRRSWLGAFLSTTYLEPHSLPGESEFGHFISTLGSLPSPARLQGSCHKKGEHSLRAFTISSYKAEYGLFCSKSKESNQTFLRKTC